MRTTRTFIAVEEAVKWGRFSVDGGQRSGDLRWRRNRTKKVDFLERQLQDAG